MSVQFGRVLKVTVATIVKTDVFGEVQGRVVELEGFRTVFKVTKTDDKHPNQGEVRITNLSHEERVSLQGKGAKWILQAGYKDDIAQVYIGDVRTCDHIREGADWTTSLKGGDGERAFQHARVSTSFAAGTERKDVLLHLIDGLKLGRGNVDNALLQNITGQHLQGYVAHGPVQAELDRILQAAGYEWSIQDGAPQVLPVGGSRDLGIPEISPTSGLIGSPEMGTPEKKGKPPLCKIRMLLRPQVKPGGRIAVKSERYSGTFRVKKVEHAGDTAQRDWYTTVEAIQV